MIKIVLILAVTVSMAAGAVISSPGTGVKGYLDDGTKWTGGAAPSNGDRFVISNADTITMRYPFTGSFTMDSARTGQYNQLIIAAKFTADAPCTLKTFNTLDLTDTLDHANNLIYYRTTSATASRYRIRYIGSLGDSAVVMSSGTWGGGLYPTSNKDNSTMLFDLKYTKFTGVGSYVASSTIAGQYINVTNCLFDTCRFFTLQHSYLADSVKINNNVYKRRHDEGVADSLLWLNYRGVGITPPAANSRSIQYNVFDGGVNYKTLTTSIVLVYAHNSVDFKISHNVFISSRMGFSSLSAGTVDSNFFCNSMNQGLNYKINFINNLGFYTWNNPHHYFNTGVSSFSYNYIENNYDAVTDLSVTTARDEGDMVFCPLSSGDSVILHHNVMIGSFGTDGAFFNFLNGAKAGKAKIYNNTIIRTVVGNYGIIRNENSGYGTTGPVNVWNNIFTSRNSGTGLVVNFERPNEPDQIDSIDYNVVYNHGASPFRNLEITGKTSGDPWFNSTVLNQNPSFVNDSFNLKWWTKKKGYDSTSQGVVDAFKQHNDYIDSFLVAYKVACTPTNSALDGTAFGSIDYGAVDFTAAQPPVITSQPTDQTVDENHLVTFTIAATDATSYQWRSKANGDVGTDSDTYAFTATLADDGDSLDCVVTNASGSTTSNKVKLTVNDTIIAPDTIWGHNDTIYVDQTLSSTTATYSAANRDNSGADGTAYNDLQTALNAAVKGTLILLRGGTYEQNGVRFTIPVSANGTAWSPGEYNEMRSYGSEWAILDGENNVTGGTWPAVLGSVFSLKYWKFENLEIKNGRSADGTNAKGFYADDGPFIFRKCYIHDNLCDISGNIPAGMSGHRWHDCLVEFCYFKNNGSNVDVNHNAGHIIIFSDYREDSTVVHGFTDTGLYVARNIWRYNLIDSGATGMRVTKGGQIFSGRNPDAGHGFNDTYKTYGDQIYGNIIRNTLDDAIVVHQDFVQVHNNIVYNCYGGISMGTIERVRYKQCVYNNTIRNTYAKGIMAHHHKYTVSFNFEPMYYGYVYNNLLDSCTYGNTSDNTWDKEELSLYVLNGWTEAKEDSFKISNCYSYRPAKRINDLTGLDIILQKTVRYTIAEYQAAINENSVLYLQDYDAGNALYTGSTGADQFKTVGTHTVNGSNTIANGGIGGNHPYLPGVTMPSYIGATDPSNDGWVDTALALKAYFESFEPIVCATPAIDSMSDTLTFTGNTVTVYGTGFGDVSAVYLNDREQTFIAYDDSVSVTWTDIVGPGTYDFWLTNSCGENSDTVSVTVLAPGTPIIVSQPQSISLPVGSNAIFTIAALGDGLLYKGYVNGDSVSPVPMVVIENITMDNNGNKIWFKVYNGSGDTVVSDTATLTVIPDSINNILVVSFGQSNANGQGVAPYTVVVDTSNVHHFKNDLSYVKGLSDPAALDGNMPWKDYDNPTITLGTYLPSMLNNINAKHRFDGITVLATGADGTSLNGNNGDYWVYRNPDNSRDTTTLYGCLVRRIDSAKVKCDLQYGTNNYHIWIVLTQGEGDAVYNPDGAGYKAALDTLFKNLKSDVRADIKFIVNQTGRTTNEAAYAGMDSIASAQYVFATTTDGAYLGAITVGVPLKDAVHYNKEGLDILGRQVANVICNYYQPDTLSMQRVEYGVYPLYWKKGNGQINRGGNTSTNFPSWPNSNLSDSLPDYTYQYNGMSTLTGSGYIHSDSCLKFNPTTLDRLQIQNYKQVLTNTSKFTKSYLLEFGTLPTIACIEGNYDDVNNYFEIIILTDRTVWCYMIVGGVVKYVATSTAFPTGKSRLDVVKDGSAIDIYFNGVKASYTNRDTYTLGTKEFTSNTQIGYRPDEAFYYEGNLFYAESRCIALSESEISTLSGYGTGINLIADSLSQSSIVFRGAEPAPVPKAIASIVRQSGNDTVYYGDTARFVAVDSGTNVSRQWYQIVGAVRVILAGQTDTSLVLPTVLPAMNGYSYRMSAVADTGDTAWSNVMQIVAQNPIRVDSTGLDSGVVLFGLFAKTIDSLKVDGTKAVGLRQTTTTKLKFYPGQTIVASKGLEAKNTMILYYSGGTYTTGFDLYNNKLITGDNPKMSLGLKVGY